MMVAAIVASVGCASSAAEDDIEEGGQAASGGETVYIVVPTLSEDEWTPIKRKVLTDHVTGPALPDGRLGISCEFDIQSEQRPCSLYLPYRPEEALQIADGEKKELSLPGPVVFSGDVAKEVFDGLATLLDHGDVRTAGPLTCRRADGTATCTIAPSRNGSRSYDVATLEYWSTTDYRHVPQATLDQIAALAK
jgi:hypothetical protein